MNFLDAAYEILREAGEPLHYTEINQGALAAHLITPKGQTPAATMGSRLYVDTKKPDTRFKRISKGYFALAEHSQGDDITNQVNAINQNTRQQLHQLLQNMPAHRFEELVGELLVAIGFDENTVVVTDRQGDGGIDVRGVLNASGITRINAAVQVKRWKKNIHAPTVQALRGSLTAHEQGIIITSSDFSKGAREEARAMGRTQISLVNGQEIVNLLIERNMGINKGQHTVLSLDEEWWNVWLSSPLEPVVEEVIELETAVVNIGFPVKVQGSNNPGLTAELLNAKGLMVYAGQEYLSPSGAGKVATGWKSANGWTYWRYQHPETSEWRAIQELRQY